MVRSTKTPPLERHEVLDDIPWQLSYVYRQMDSIVDSLSYEELYDLFGGHPTPPAITREEVKILETSKFGSEKHDAGIDLDELRHDQASCPICLEDYNEGDKLMVLPTCNHVFHAKCVVR